jgi:hypothetical protein
LITDNTVKGPISAEHSYEWHKDGKRYVMKNVDADRSRDIPVWSIEEGNPLGF